MTTSTATSQCTACGADVYGTRFCESCGAPQIARVALAGEVAQPVLPPPARRSVMTARRWWILGATIAAISVGAVAIAVVSAQGAVASARAAYAATVAEYSALVAERNEAEDAAIEVLDPEVADPADDPAVLAEIARLLEIVQQTPIDDPVDVDRSSDAQFIDKSTTALAAVVADLRTDLNALTQAVDALLDARAARALDAAVADLDQALAEGESALAGSEGRVTDESVRQVLSAALDDGRSERDAEVRDPERIVAASAAIRTATAAVAAARVPAFTDVGGTWCYWENIAVCVTVDLPRVGDDSVIQPPGADSFYSPRGDGWTYVVPNEPCFTTGVGAANGDPFGSAVFVYCPRGVSSNDPFQNFNNPLYERIYISQQGSIDPYFRIEEWAAATGR